MALHVCVRGIGIRRSKGLRAEIGKCPNSTNERKNMSTKTNFKRVALVAVAALGAGVLSVAPANAGAPTAGDFNAAATAATDNFGIVSVTGKNIEMLSNGQLKIKSAVADIDAGADTDILRLKISSGSGVFTFASTGTNVTAQTASTAADGQSVSFTATNDTNDSGDAGAATALFRPTGTGTITVQYQSVTGAGVVTVKDTLTIYSVATAAASVSGTLSVANSFFSREDSGTAATNNVDSSTSAIAQGSIGYVGLDLRDALGGDLAVGAIIVTATNGAKVAYGADANATTGTSTAVAADAGTSDYFSVRQPMPANGVSYAPMTTTVSLSYNGTVVGTKTLKFTGVPTKVNVSSIPSAIATSGTATVAVTVTDADGNQLAGWTPVAGSTLLDSNLSAGSFNSSSATATVAATLTAGGLSGASSTTIRVALNDGTFVVSDPIKTISSGALDVYTISFDKASYVPGEVVTLTITGKDAEGYAIADGVALGTSAVSVTTTGLTDVDATALAHGKTALGGVWTEKYYASTTLGSYGISFKSDKATAKVPAALTATFKVVSADTGVTNADVLKAIVSLIASINKQIAALQKALLRR
jgi:trimeric autotransporter adhesin